MGIGSEALINQDYRLFFKKPHLKQRGKVSALPCQDTFNVEDSECTITIKSAIGKELVAD
jgi:hypothetical protein